jgi:hypothetical protein
MMKDEDYKPRKYHEVNSFFRNSWGQVPDKTSSRFMQPRTVVKQHEEPKGASLAKGEKAGKQVACGSDYDENESQEGNQCQKEASVEAKTDKRTNIDESDKEKHICVPASAIYASTYDPGYNVLF